MLRAAIFPEEFGSFQHVMDTAGVFLVIYSAGKAIDSAGGESAVLSGREAEAAAADGAADAISALKPQNLLDELAESGVKYSADDVVMVTRMSDGTLVWLETGSESTGLQHILDRHATQFANRGITDIPELLKEILQTTPEYIELDSRGYIADFVFDGNKYRVAYGTNGFVVSFFPAN